MSHPGNFHFRQFDNLERLYSLKQSSGISISVGIPTLNEAETIGSIIDVIRSVLIQETPIVDEIAIIDSGSTDSTVNIALEKGAMVFASDLYLPEVKAVHGKGENLWKSLYLLKGDIIVWVDADIQNFHSGFITGLVGPLLENTALQYTTAYYQRPYQNLIGNHSYDGGRVTELLVRPFLNYLFPELTHFYQPMAGEHAGRRPLLERLAFSTGYAVDVCHLIDITRHFDRSIIAQVNLDKRVHCNRSISELSEQAFAVLQALMKRAEDWGRISVYDQYNQFRTFKYEGPEVQTVVSDIVELTRPPIISLNSYCEKFGIKPVSANVPKTV